MGDFEEYIQQTEPDKKEKGIIWQTAIGLQQVDGLKPSAYLIETAKQNIEGDISFDEVKSRIDNYYKILESRQPNADTDVTNKLGVNKNTPNLLQADKKKKLGVKLNKNQLKMLELIAGNNRITITEMAEKLSISTTAIENNMKKLREKGIVAREGSDKTGCWEIT